MEPETELTAPLRGVMIGSGAVASALAPALERGGNVEWAQVYSPDINHARWLADELISARKDLEGVREEICADSLAFLTPGALLKAGNRKELCMACFTGEYPTALYQSVDEANKDVKC